MISILVAYTKKDRIIGNKGVIPWNLPSERTRFKEICKDRFIIMGRKTFDEIGHRLPYCTIIIISRTLKNPPEGCLLASSLKDGIKLAQTSSARVSNLPPDKEILIAGGGDIYRQVLSIPESEEFYVTKIYATEIEGEYEGDVTFPPIEKYGKWKITYREKKSEKDIDYSHVTYEKEI